MGMFTRDSLEGTKTLRALTRQGAISARWVVARFAASFRLSSLRLGVGAGRLVWLGKLDGARLGASLAIGWFWCWFGWLVGLVWLRLVLLVGWFGWNPKTYLGHVAKIGTH